MWLNTFLLLVMPYLSVLDWYNKMNIDAECIRMLQLVFILGSRYIMIVY